MSNSVLNIPQESNLSGINRNSKRKRTIQYDTFDGVEFKETAIIPRSNTLCMLPHSATWEVIIIASIIINVLFQCIAITYHQVADKKNSAFYFMQYTMEVLYILHLFFTILHRNFSIHKNDYCSKKMPFMHLFIGFITIIPSYEFYEYLLDREPYIYLQTILNLKVVVRLIHVYLFFSRCRVECELNKLTITFMESFYINSIYICLVACIFGWFGCSGCEFSNWTTHLQDVVYDFKDIRERLIYPMMFVGSLLLGNYSGIIIPETIPEIVCVFVTLMASLILKINFMLANFIAESVRSYRRNSKFKMRMKKIQSYIEFEQLSKTLKTDIMEYYNVLWTKRAGITNLNPSFLKLIPLSLKNEVTLDLGWDAISHSHLFRDQKLAVKTAVAKLMVSRFMVKDDVIYDSGDLKSCLIYIVSGIVQLLSEEDNESPILSFSSGTVFSECSCLMLSHCKYKLQCASYCELRVLHLTDFYRGMTLYKDIIRKCRQMLRARLQFARTLRRRKKIDLAERHSSRPIRRIKLYWHNILQGWPIIDNYHTSKYMDLFAIIKNTDLKVEVVCLTSKFPLIMDPYSSFRRFCSVCVLVACLIQTIIIPYCAAFRRELHPGLRSFLFLLDIIYVLDIYMQITTALMQNDNMLTKFSTIMIYRIQQWTFLVDVFAILPVDYIYWSQGCSPRVFIMLKIPRIFKIYKLIRFIRNFETSMVNVNGIFIILVKYYLMWLICVYVFACLFFVRSCYTPDCVPYSWYPYNLELSNQTQTDIKPVMSSLLFVANILSNGKKIAYSYDYVDSTLTLFLIIIAYYLIPMATSELTANLYWKMKDVAQYKIITSSVLDYVRIHKLKQSVVTRVANMLNFRWDHSRGLIELSASEFLRELPVKLEERAREEMIGQYFDKQVLFQTLRDTVRKRIVSTADLISYPEGATIIDSNNIISHIYIIKRGVCKATSVVPGDEERNTQEKIFSAGACFPVVDLLHAVPSFLNVRALTAVDVIVISYGTFMEAIKYDPGYQETLLSTLKLHLTANKVILHRKQYFQPAERVIRRQTIYFRYQINDEIDIEVKKTPFIMKTINPNSAYYLVYEIIRCCLVIFQFFILSLQMNLLYEYRHNIQKLHITCDVLSWIDIFIRLRLHYYRSDGILVTDFKSVAKHYITHAFAVDFYASCPFSTLSVDAMINISKPVVVKHFLLCLSRPLQLYRVFLGISYLCPRIKVTSEVTIVRIQCILFMMVVIPIGANLLVLSACVIDSDSLRCPMNGWGGGDITEITPMTSLVHYAYLASLYLHGCPFNGYAEKSNFSYTIYLFITLISLSLAWFMMSKLINLGLHGQFMTLRLQNDRTHFQKFAKLEGVNSKLTKRLLEVNSLLTKKSSRTALQEASKRLPPQLFSDLTYGFNELSFKNNKLFFDAAHSIQRHLASHFKRIFFIKDDIIIRNNDINQYIFIVVRGSVKVSVAGCKIAVMQVGGMFGCLSDKKRIRQLIDVTAATHTECIYVKSTVLNRYLYNYKTVKRRISSYVKQNMEYVEACAATANDDSSTIQVLPPTHTTRYTRFFKKLQQSLHRSRGGFRTYYYLLNVHLSAFSTMFILILQMVAMHEDLSYHFYIILYLLDAMFIVKILLSFTLPFVDATSGIVVVKMKTIIFRYLMNEFAIDLANVLMPELYFGYFFSSEFHVALLTSNRILRIILFARYYNRSRVSNNLTHSLRRIFIAYITLIYLQFTTNVWFYVACSLHVGRYRKFVSHAPEEYIPILTLYHTYLFSYVHVLNVFTGNGVKAIKPLNIEEIIVTIIITISSVFMMSAIASRCALVQIIDNYSLNYYRNKIDEVKTHLTNLRLSPYILHKLVRYYEFIWRIQRGNQFPMLINETGRYLREDIRIDLYSELILQNAIFKNAHKDFIRQMLVNLKRFAYPRSMVIVHQHEVNGSMYFIQSGNVAIVDVSTNGDMKKVGFLKAGQSFGEVQGLTIAPFQFTYVAETLVIVMSLRKKSWAYLLEFFPATMNNIQQNLSEHFGVTDKI